MACEFQEWADKLAIALNNVMQPVAISRPTAEQIHRLLTDYQQWRNDQEVEASA